MTLPHLGSAQQGTAPLAASGSPSELPISGATPWAEPVGTGLLMHGLVDEELKAATLAEEWGGHRALNVRELGLAAYDHMQQLHYEQQAQLYWMPPQPPPPGQARSPVQDTASASRPMSWQKSPAPRLPVPVPSSRQRQPTKQHGRQQSPLRYSAPPRRASTPTRVAFHHYQQPPTPPHEAPSRSASSPSVVPPPPAAPGSPTWPPDLHARLHAEQQERQRPLQRVASALTHQELYSLHQRMLAAQHNYSPARHQSPLHSVPPLHEVATPVQQALHRVESAWRARKRSPPGMRAPAPPVWRP